ncbi:MAG: gfo/Idh/MocA family oxidoreductase, partial [Verrucomicrobia bacterium]|nr:gfo/Idh/MocA family oxidoreductase [Verrucomicrobiota bacterium]
GNQGIHQMDIARRFLGAPALAPGVLSVGGRLGYKDDGETPNSLVVFQDYKPAPLLFEVRGLPAAPDSQKMDEYHGASIGVVAHYEGGRIVCPNNSDALAYDKDGQMIAAFGKPPAFKSPEEAAKVKVIAATNEDQQNHYANFLRAVRSGKESDLNGKILDGHISSALCHTGNISYQLGKQLSPGASREKLKGTPQALESFERLLAHLGVNGIDLNQEQLVMGEFLKMNPETETFIGNKAADALLTREYRAPFTIPALA